MTSRVVACLLVLAAFARADDVGIEQRLGERVPLDAPFTDSSGRATSLRVLCDGRPAVLALVYYGCPRLCTLVLNGLFESVARLPLRAGEDFAVIAVSIDPTETPALAAEKRANYLRRHGLAGRGVHFLTGAQESIDALAGAIGYRYRYDPASGLFAHAAGIVVTTRDAEISRVLYGVSYPPDTLRLALVEAGDGRIGTLVDRLLLLCFSYDPETGRYGFAVLSALRAGGVLTVLAVVVFVARALRRERSAP